MRFGVYEFEIAQVEGIYAVVPYDFDGATQGIDYAEACEMGADWLKTTIEDYEIHGRALPPATFGNVPRYGGTNVVFAVMAGRETVDKVSATQAARMLGITPSRVSHMLASNLLEGWRDGRNTFVTVDSINARLAERPKAGRPKLDLAAAV